MGTPGPLCKALGVKRLSWRLSQDSLPCCPHVASSEPSAVPSCRSPPRRRRAGSSRSGRSPSPPPRPRAAGSKRCAAPSRSRWLDGSRASRWRNGSGTRAPCSTRATISIRCRGRRCSAISPSGKGIASSRSEEHTSELQSRLHLVCRLLLEKKKKTDKIIINSTTHTHNDRFYSDVYAEQATH